jgi:hypothetical protein
MLHIFGRDFGRSISCMDPILALLLQQDLLKFCTDLWLDSTIISLFTEKLPVTW